MGKREWEHLYILRTFACIWVMAVHWEQRIILPGILHRICAGGAWSPIIFFVLSGFLALPSLQRELRRSGKTGWKSWLMKRAVRLLLIYYVIILFYYIFYTIVGTPEDETGLGWLRYLFLNNDCIPSENVFWTNIGAVWTVSAFMFFDLLVPLYYKVVKNYRMAWAGVAIMFLLSEGIAHYTNWFHTLQCFRYFALGVLTYMAIEEHREHCLLVMSSILILLWFVVTGRCEVGVIAMMFIAASSDCVVSSGKFIPYFKMFSKYSYSIYLVHVAVLVVLDHSYHGSAIGYTILFLSATVLCSFGTYWLIERHLGERMISIFCDKTKKEC